MYLNLSDIKKHLYIDDTFTDDDEYLLSLADVAEKVVERHIDAKLNVIVELEGGVLPSPLIQAMKLFIGNMYSNRESISFASTQEIPLSYQYLLSLYKNYSNENNV